MLKPARPDRRMDFAASQVKRQAKAERDGRVWRIAGAHRQNIERRDVVFALSFLAPELFEKPLRIACERAYSLRKTRQIAILEIAVAAVRGRRRERVRVAHRTNERAITAGRFAHHRAPV